MHTCAIVRRHDRIADQTSYPALVSSLTSEGLAPGALGLRDRLLALIFLCKQWPLCCMRVRTYESVPEAW